MQDNRPIGIIRTFAWLGREFSVPAWVDAIKKGHTYLSSGPVVQFSINGKIPGERIELPAAGGEVSVEGAVWSNTPIRKIVVHQNGKVLWEIPVGADPHHSVFSRKAHVRASSWFGLVVEAEELPPAPQSAYSQAITNCIRVYTGSQKIRSAESAQYFLTWIEKLRKQIADPSLWRTPAEQQHVEAQLNEAARVYRARLEEAGR
jgi:hypothetical protein